MTWESPEITKMGLHLIHELLIPGGHDRGENTIFTGPTRDQSHVRSLPNSCKNMY